MLKELYKRRICISQEESKEDKRDFDIIVTEESNGFALFVNVVFINTLIKWYKYKEDALEAAYNVSKHGTWPEGITERGQ